MRPTSQHGFNNDGSYNNINDVAVQICKAGKKMQKNQ